MTFDMDERSRRRHSVGADDQRDRFSRDRDRILYCSAFHRLAGVTQIVRAGEEDVFHTRQQHSIKVAQIGRRLAEYCLSQCDESDLPALKNVINPEVVEAACLAHDLGHPPFGHAGEAVLDKLVQNPTNSEEAIGDPDGFEGNAQTFRILTKLSIRHPNCSGLDLTRATLGAVLKYPWLRDLSDDNKKSKWSVYSTEKDDFEFARKYHSGDKKTAEAELMDFADDIAYSVHDLEDFHRANALPWHVIFQEEGMEQLRKNTLASWHKAPPEAPGYLSDGMKALENMFKANENLLVAPYVGSSRQRWWLRNLTSQLIRTFLQAVKIGTGDQVIEIDPVPHAMVLLLKRITRDYIFSRPALAAQQEGQAKLIADLFHKIYDKSDDSWPPFLPIRLRYLWELSKQDGICQNPRARFAADCIASLTENEVLGLHARLFGTASGSVLHPIVR